MTDEPTGGDKPVTEGDGENFGDTKVVPEPGTEDAGTNGEDSDILGKSQEDLTAEDLEGDARDDDHER